MTRFIALIDLTSNDGYEVANGNESKCKIQLTGYFKTELLVLTQENYQKILDKFNK